MKKIVEIAHDMLAAHIGEQGIGVDFTMGQGLDTAFLASIPSCKHVYAFDIQEQALEVTMHRLQQMGCEAKVDCILDNHIHCLKYIHETIDVGIFNFGFLPHGDSSITTILEHSKLAVLHALRLLKKHGLLVLVIYPGHVQGKQESDFFHTWSQNLPSAQFSVCKIEMHNKAYCPYIIGIEKIKEIEDESSYI